MLPQFYIYKETEEIKRLCGSEYQTGKMQDQFLGELTFFKVARKDITNTFQSRTRVLYFCRSNHRCSMKGERLYL